jgi:hypothetical protein
LILEDAAGFDLGERIAALQATAHGLDWKA